MKTLKLGSKGADVRSLQVWLANFEPMDTDGYFGELTKDAVRRAQAKFELEDDGIVGSVTAGRFMVAGWLPNGFDRPGAPETPYPKKPSDFTAIPVSSKIKKFGSPGTAPAQAEPGGPIKRDPSFSANVVNLDLRDWFPHVTGVTGLQLHKKVELQWRALFDDIVAASLGARIESCAGSWNPRFVRGSTTVFSSHAFATAVDFNAPQNWLGARPATKGKTGSLVEIVPLAEKYQIWWGGWFPRVDGMHFESTATDVDISL